MIFNEVWIFLVRSYKFDRQKLTEKKHTKHKKTVFLDSRNNKPPKLILNAIEAIADCQ